MVSLKSVFYCGVTSYSISIEQHFLGNQFVSSTNDTDFAWYSKCGGENSGLKFIFHLKDEKGHIFNPSLAPLELNTELVYADGFATPFMPLSPLKEQKFSRASKKSTAWLAVTVLLVCVFSLLWVVLSCMLFSYCTMQWRVTVTILYSTVYRLVFLWLFFGRVCFVLVVFVL